MNKQTFKFGYLELRKNGEENLEWGVTLGRKVAHSGLKKKKKPSLRLPIIVA